MRTIQKKVKFSKGQIDQKLLERQDLELVDSSASEIINLVSTPYGSIQTRMGTIDIGDYEETVEIDAINNNVSSYGYSFNEATMKAGGWYQSGDISSLADGSEVFTIDLGSETKAYEFDFQMYFNGISNYGDVGLFVVTATDGVITEVFGNSFQNIKTPIITAKAESIELTSFTGEFKLTEASEAVFTESSVGKLILLVGAETFIINEYISPTEVMVANYEGDALTVFTTVTQWIYEGTTYNTNITLSDYTGTATVLTTGDPFTSDSLYDYIGVDSKYCWITGYNSVNSVDINVSELSTYTFANYDYIESTRLEVVGRASVPTVTGSGAIVAIPYTQFNGNIASGYLDIISGGSGYISSTGGYVIDATIDSLVSSTAMVQKSDNGSDWTDVEEITITNSLLDGGDTKKIVIDDSVQYIRVISDAVQGRYYIGGFNIIKYEYGYIRIEPFIFNDAEKYLVIFSKNLITIYDGSVFTRIDYLTLTETQIKELKVTQKEDVMVITHPDFYPIQLVRSSFNIDNDFDTLDGWTLQSVWTLGTGKITALGTTAPTTANAYKKLNSNLKTGDTYTLNFKVTDYAGTFVLAGFSSGIPISGGGQVVSTATADGDYSITFVADADYDYVYFLHGGGAGLTESIDSVSLTNESGLSYQWVASNLPLVNIAKHNFDGDTTTAKTSTLTPDITEGLVTITSSASDFTTDSVGQYIDGGGGRVKITDYVSATKVRGVTIVPFYTVEPFSTWNYISGYETVWSATRGYPTSCLFYQGRLWFGGSKSRPSTIWGSRVDDYVNFKNVGNYSNDAIDVTIDSTQSAEILSIYPNRGIQVFCEGSEWIIPEGNLTPDGITITRNTANGIIRGIEPTDISGITLFLEKNGKSLLSFVYNEGQNAYVTSQASMLTSLIDAPIDMDVDYNSAKNRANYLYIVKEDGTMAVACILIDQQINSFVNFTSYGEIKSVCTLGDRIYVTVTRGSGTHIEYFDEDSLVDCRNVPLSQLPIEGGIALVTVDSKFVGETLDFYSNGVYLGQKTINSSAQAIVNSPAGIMYFGYPIEYSMTSNKIAINGQTGSIRTRISEAVIETNNTSKLTFNGSTKLSSNDRFMFNACSSPSRDTRFNIVGNFDRIEVLSILLRINYGTR